MAHNFHRHIELNLPVTACVFVSKAGSDATDGLTPDTPKKTILAGCQAAQAAGRANVIVGADVFAGEQLGLAVAGLNLYADGCVVLKGDVGLTLADPQTSAVSFTDFIIFRYDTLLVKATNSQTTATFQRCYVTGGSAAVGGYDRLFFWDCTLKNVAFSDASTLNSGLLVMYCNVLNSSIDCRYAYNYNYADAATSLSLRDSAALPTNENTLDPSRWAQITNTRGPVALNGTSYTSLAAARAAQPTSFPASFSADPQFNRADKDDYSLKITSPHLNTSIGPRHLRLSSAWFLETDANPGEDITLSNIRLRSVANSQYFVLPLTVSNLVANAQGGIEVKPNSLNNAEGTITWAPRRIADAATEINYYNFATGLNFNSDFTPDTANPAPYNSNVPDYSNFGAGAAGRNPNRLSEQWRWSRGINPDPNSSSDWVTGSQFLDFELFRAPWFNTGNTLRGNADPLFDWNSPRELPTATFVQSRWKLRQDRTI